MEWNKYKISCQGVIGDRIIIAEVGRAPGGGEAWHILVDKYYHGMLNYKHGRWQINLHPNSFLDSADASILIDIIEDHLRVNHLGSP